MRGLRLGPLPRNRQNGDVVVLSESLCGLYDSLGRLDAECSRAFKPEERSAFVTRLDDPVRHQCQLAAGFKHESGFNVYRVCREPERQAVFEIQFTAI